MGRKLASWAVDLRFDTFMFWPSTDPIDQLRRFAGDVVPCVRELLAARSPATPQGGNP